MDRSAASAFYQIVNQRYEKQYSTIVTTNRSLPDRGQIFGDIVVASAILDRLMHNAVVFNIKCPSWRLREHQALNNATTERRSSYHPKPTRTQHPTQRVSLIANTVRLLTSAPQPRSDNRHNPSRESHDPQRRSHSEIDRRGQNDLSLHVRVNPYRH